MSYPLGYGYLQVQWLALVAETRIDGHIPLMRRTLSVLILMLGTGCSDQKYDLAKMCGGRPAHWQAPENGIGELIPLQPIRVTRRNEIGWNGAIIKIGKLDAYLESAKDLSPAPQIVLHVEDGADCALVRKVRSSMETHLGCSTSGACGEGRGWRRWPGAKTED